MSDNVFIWILNRGVELGAIVLFLLPIRAILRRTAPRVFSYLLWCVIPVSVLFKLWETVVSHIYYHEVVPVNRMSSVPVLGLGLQIGKWILLIGTIGMLFYRICAYIRLRGYLIGSIRLQENIYIAARISAPFSMGVIQPKIYLPSSINEKCYGPVILHERVHISRKDIWMNHVGILLLIIFWFQPLLWIAYHLFEKDMEVACDEAVVRKNSLEFREQYAKALVEVSYQAGKLGGVAMGYGGGEIKERIKNVMTYKKSKRFVVFGAMLACFVAVFVVISVMKQVPMLFRIDSEMKISNAEEGWDLIIGAGGISEDGVPIER